MKIYYSLLIKLYIQFCDGITGIKVNKILKIHLFCVKFNL